MTQIDYTVSYRESVTASSADVTIAGVRANTANDSTLTYSVLDSLGVAVDLSDADTVWRTNSAGDHDFFDPNASVADAATASGNTATVGIVGGVAGFEGFGFAGEDSNLDSTAGIVSGSLTGDSGALGAGNVLVMTFNGVFTGEAVVPEPTVAPLLILSLAGVVARRKRK